MSKAVVFFADGTEECEALLVIDLLRRAKVEVTVASAMGRKEVVSSHKIHLTADALAEDVDYSDVDLVVLPGGIPGTPNLAENKTVTDTCVSFAKAGKKVAAICAAPSVLASLGLLEGRNATAHAGFQDKLAGAIVHDEEVVVDGNLTTSYGLGGAIPFALELAAQLTGRANAEAVAKHFVAVSTALEKVEAFGIDPANAFGFWNWVGGRYSVDSAVGLSLIVVLGPERFQQFLEGFHAIDEYFCNTPLENNAVALMGLVSYTHLTLPTICSV